MSAACRGEQARPHDRGRRRGDPTRVKAVPDGTEKDRDAGPGDIEHSPAEPPKGKIKEQSPVRVPTPKPNPDPFPPLLIDPNQCPDCIGDERMTLQERTFRYCRPTIRNDHFDDAHLEERERIEQCGEPIRCHHPKCRDIKFQHLDHFRNHVQTVHGMPLRSSDQVKRRREGKLKRRQMIRERRNGESELILCQG